MRLSTATLVAVAAAAVLLVLAVTNLVLPADTARLTDTRPWIAARATGVTAYLLLAAQVVAGLVMSHPTNLSTWKQSKRLFPWHEHLAVFAISFLVIHVVAISIDRYANVGVLGAIVPGLRRTGRRRSPSGRSPCTACSSRRSPRAGPSSCRAAPG